jgi:hypothetical protein
MCRYSIYCRVLAYGRVVITALAGKWEGEQPISRCEAPNVFGLSGCRTSLGMKKVSKTDPK